MSLPLETDMPASLGSLLAPDKAELVATLNRVARDLLQLERLSPRDGEEAWALAEASRAIHRALVELEPSA